MQKRAPQDMPFVVRFATMGRPTTRKRMQLALVAMLALTAVAVVVWLSDPESATYQFLVVVGLAFAAAEALTIRWIDQHGDWSS